ncbi:V-type ATP synthase subunit F [Imhoffiella purpurea]|uniref:ATPase n=1 Tax=Imhoffiella purpurea TaxID=1249627 RepID=W9VDK3_9GAMM|nr:V-type ATP synthase subunit F [Imhoffiella purpurea]EXJ14122.1 hypothetical protein D779_2936 [Imhoffiella purpurea]
MDAQPNPSQTTRMLFLGDARLADGFRLIGFETHPDPTPETVDGLFRELQRARDKAFVIVDDAIMGRKIPHLERARREGGRILVIAVPALNAPPELTSEVAQRLAALFGASALEPSHTGERQPQ